MITMRLPLDSLVVEVAATTEEAFAATGGDEFLPVLVAPIADGRYLVVDSVAKLKAASGREGDGVECIVAPPIYGDRGPETYLPARDAQRASPLASYKELVRLQMSASDRFSRRSAVRSHRGTMVKLVLEVDFAGRRRRYFINPLERDIGGLLFDPVEAVNRFEHGTLDAAAAVRAFGREGEHEAATLPAAVAVSDDGRRFQGVGSWFDKRSAYRKRVETSADLELTRDDMLVDLPERRGRVVGCEVFVLYPNGATYEGAARVDGASLLMLWSEHLVRGLIEETSKASYFRSDWWDNPTSLIMADIGGGECARIEHTCNDCAMVK